ncbi:MAG: FAD-binding oxidoreductase [Zoogloeaceae bacterium]|jgi:FAD/FMN-containing dehydrogenase|nr:FAD-binding oxidoreductase [Zoogloeaceae bacterium]
MSQNKCSFLKKLAAIVGSAHLLTDPVDFAPALTDWRGRYTGKALALVRPGSAAEAQAVVRACLAANLPMQAQGGNTGLVGGATPDASGRTLLIQMSRLNRIRNVDAANNALTAEAGCSLQAVQAAAIARNRLFPLSLAAEGSCQIGGNLAANAGGVQVLRYGAMRDLTLGLEAVLPNGDLFEGLAGLRKNNVGYDLRHLLIGAEGTLGLITAATLKLFPLPEEKVTLWLEVASPAAAVDLLNRTQAAFDAQLTAFELICPLALKLLQRHFPQLAFPTLTAPWHVLCEFSGSRDDHLPEKTEHFIVAALAKHLAQDALLAQSEAQRKAFWRIRENISEAQKKEGVSIKHDIALPVSRIDEFLTRVIAPLAAAFPCIRHTAFGHLGDGNLHFNLSMPEPEANARLLARESEASRIVYDQVHALGGSISAEHGIGRLKRDLLPRYQSPTRLTALRAIKQALDPKGLMNPGVLL